MLDKQRTNMLIGFASGLAVDAGVMVGGIPTGGFFSREFARSGARAYSVQFEREADYVGAYYAARAGYDLDGTEELWCDVGSAGGPEQLAVRQDASSGAGALPANAAVAAEIAEKQREASAAGAGAQAVRDGRVAAAEHLLISRTSSPGSSSPIPATACRSAPLHWPVAAGTS